MVALLFLVSLSGKVVALLLAALLPVAAWIYAHHRFPGHVRAVVGATCGLVAFPVSLGLFSLLFLPFPLQLLGLPGIVGEALHGLPGNIVGLITGLEHRSDQSMESVLIDYLVNGFVWAVTYGLIGHRLDRRRR